MKTLLQNHRLGNYPRILLPVLLVIGLSSWAVVGAAALLPDGRVLVAGGILNDRALASVEIFDPVTSSWSTTGSLVTGRDQHATATLLDGTVLVAGGVDRNNEGLGKAELYSP